MNYNEEDLKEFRTESLSMLDDCEQRLLSLEKGKPLLSEYDAIFRTFHSLKGGAGMLNLVNLQNHMHMLENIFSKLKSNNDFPKEKINFFLNAVDAAKLILDGKDINFSFESDSSPPPSSKKNISENTKTIASSHESSTLVYLVDDEPAILDIISSLLLDVGLSNKAFGDPNELIIAVKKYPPPSLIITDMKMPTMTGLELLEKIKKIDVNIPVIFLSGFLDKNSLIKILENGVFAAIEKPFDEKNLLTHINSAIKIHNMKKMINRSINLLLYQFSDLDDFLISQGKEDIRKMIRNELNQIIDFRKKIDAIKKSDSVST